MKLKCSWSDQFYLHSCTIPAVVWLWFPTLPASFPQAKSTGSPARRHNLSPLLFFFYLPTVFLFTLLGKWILNCYWSSFATTFFFLLRYTLSIDMVCLFIKCIGRPSYHVAYSYILVKTKILRSNLKTTTHGEGWGEVEWRRDLLLLNQAPLLHWSSTWALSRLAQPHLYALRKSLEGWGQPHIGTQHVPEMIIGPSSIGVKRVVSNCEKGSK